MKILISLILLSFATISLYSAKLVKKVSNPTIKVSFVDVGQGDAEVIQDLSTGKVIVVDTGVKNSGIVEYLKSENIKTIDLMILTHPHSDHIGSGVQIINNFKVKRVLDSGFKHSSRTYLKLLEKIKEKNISYIKGMIGQNIKFGKSRIHVLAPPKNFITGTRSDANSNSVVFLLTQNKFSVYFAADSEHETEEFVVKNNTILKADIYKVAHHGSRYATGDDILDKINPEIAIISAGLNNSYHHPAPSTMEKFKKRNIKTYVTFKVGTIIAESNGTSYSIKTVKTGNSRAHNSLSYIKEEDPDNYNEIIEENSKSKRKHSGKTFAQLDSNGKAILKSGHFYASKNSKKFYAWNCKGPRRVKPSNLLEFSSFQEAVNTNRTLSSRCKYTESTNVQKNSDNSMNFDKPIQKASTSSSNKININTASAKELTSIKGIGKKTAEKIINYRKSNKFKKIEDIMKVKGIGKGKFRKLKDFIRVN